MKKFAIAAVLVQALLFVPALCGAAIVTYHFEGVIEASQPPFPEFLPLTDPLGNPTTFAGTFVYDTEGTPFIDPLDPTYAIYQSLQALAVAFSQPGVNGGSSFAMDSYLTLNLWNDDPFFHDTFDAAGSSAGGEFDMAVTLTDDTGAAFATNTSLPAALDLAHFTAAKLLFVYQPASGLPAPDLRSHGRITGLWAVPEPSIFEQALAAAEGLDGDDFTKKNLRKPFVKKLRVALGMVEGGNERGALQKYQRDILPDIDGCALRGAPDRNDWVADCEDQGLVYPLVEAAIAELEGLP